MHKRLLGLILCLTLFFPKTISAVDEIVDEIIINEVMANPGQGSEWIELFNTTSQSRDLKNWYLQDDAGKKILINDAIPSNGYLVVSPSSDILNNSGDSLTLFSDDD